MKKLKLFLKPRKYKFNRKKRREIARRNKKFKHDLISGGELFSPFIPLQVTT